MVEETIHENSDFQILDVAFGGVDERGESLLSPDEQAQNERVMYGDLVLETAPKEGKANTLLTSALFSPSFFLAERIEMGLLPVAGHSVLELGAGAALPSILLSTLPRGEAPILIVTTDYPDDTILGTLMKNVDHNIWSKRLKTEVSEFGSVVVAVEGYKWGDNPIHVLRHLKTINSTSPDIGPSVADSNVDTYTAQPNGFGILILSDLLHFDSSHGEIIQSIVLMLNKVDDARVYVIAGKYTRREICESFLKRAAAEGLVWEEMAYDEQVGLGSTMLSTSLKWRGKLPVRIGKRLLTEDELADRRNNCWGWIGRWGKATFGNG